MRISEIAVHRIAIADPPLRSSSGGEAPADALEKLRPRPVGANPFKLTGTLADMVVGKGSGDARS